MLFEASDTSFCIRGWANNDYCNTSNLALQYICASCTSLCAFSRPYFTLTSMSLETMLGCTMRQRQTFGAGSSRTAVIERFLHVCLWHVELSIVNFVVDSKRSQTEHESKGNRFVRGILLAIESSLSWNAASTTMPWSAHPSAIWAWQVITLIFARTVQPYRGVFLYHITHTALDHVWFDYSPSKQRCRREDEKGYNRAIFERITLCKQSGYFVCILRGGSQIPPVINRRYSRKHCAKTSSSLAFLQIGRL